VTTPAGPWPGQRVLLWSCVILAALLRLAIFPHALSLPEEDEPGYLSDGLLLVEGATPAHKYAPSGPLTWFGATYAGAGALITWSADGPELAQFPKLLRPVAALEATLFYIYADLSSLRLSAVTLVVLLSLVSVGAVFRFGDAVAGPTGALTTGLIAASVPLYVELSTQTRPYAIAWAFALVAFAVSGTGKARGQALRAGIYLGVAVGAHVDMVRVAPFILLLQWRRRGGAPPWCAFGTIIAASMVTFLLVAPWYVTHLIDNLRQILTVRILRANGEGTASPWDLWWDAGLLVALALTLAGLLLAAVRRRTPDFLCGAWLLANTALAFRPSPHGIHHDGALLVAVIGLVPIALSSLRDFLPALRQPAGGALLIALAAGPALWQGGAFTLSTARAPDETTAWIERNAPAGARVYIEGNQVMTPLPTAAAAERLWADVAAPDAWIPKYVHDTESFGLGGARPLRVMSQDRIASDLGERRRFLILGAPLRPDRPRYDLWIVSDGSIYDVSKTAVVARLCRDGGFYVHYGEPIPELPPPSASWSKATPTSPQVYRVTAGGCPDVPKRP
jgi:hypothetical protein